MKTDISRWQLRLTEELIASHTHSGAWQNTTVSDLALELAARAPDRITHVFEGKPYAISSLLADAQSLAASLHQRGLRAGDVVSFQLPSWFESMVIDLAASLLGLVVAPIVPIYRDAEVRFMLADCRAKAIFIPTL